MAMVDGGALVGKALANEGVEKAFVLCGGHIMPIFYGMRNAGIEIIDMRHECSAIYAAIAYTRTSGKAAVVVTTAGPGVGNTPAGMNEAESMGIPLLHIGGAVTTTKRDAGDLQDMETLNLMESCSKWARKITRTERIPEYISMAYRQALSSPTGPAYLEIPTDLLFVQVEEEKTVFPVNYRTNAIPYCDPALIDQAADMLLKAQHPILLLDDGARYSIGDCAVSIEKLSDYLKIPISMFGSLCRGLFGDEYTNPLLKSDIMTMTMSDLVVSMGVRFDWRYGFGNLIPADAKVIQIHTDARQIGYNRPADLGIVGGAGPAAKQLLTAVKAKQKKPVDRSWTGAEDSKGGTAQLIDDYRTKGIPMHPARCAGEVCRFLEEEGRDWNIICDGGEAAVWMGFAATVSRPGQFHATGPNGTVGTGPGLAIGAWTANRKPVLWYTGDGSFGFYAMEMDTMAKLGIPVICVISNDSSWGMIKLTESFIRPEEIRTKGHCNVELHHMRAYEKMAAMWDGYGEHVNDPDQIIPAIRRAVANGKPSIINVEVDKVSVSPMIAAYLNMIKPGN